MVEDLRMGIKYLWLWCAENVQKMCILCPFSTSGAPGSGRTHSADQKSTWELAELTLPTEIDPGRGGTHSSHGKSTQDVAEMMYEYRAGRAKRGSSEF